MCIKEQYYHYNYSSQFIQTKTQTFKFKSTNFNSSTYNTMSEYTQTQACKHLLQVAENIIYSSQVDEQILHKYEQLKRSIMKKIPKQSQTYYLSLLSTYRHLIDNAVKTVHAFQEELQGEMERKHYSQTVMMLNEEFQHKIADLQTMVDAHNSSKTRLMHKEEINTLKYQYDQLDSKFQNLGLLIEVHKKMHQIILQATRTEQKRHSVQQAYKQKISMLENSIQGVADINAFIQQHKITENKYAEFKLASKTLNKVLFGQFR